MAVTEDKGTGGGCADAMCDEKRRQFSARVCVVAASGLSELCRLHGVTASGFLDALGHRLGDLATLSDEELAGVAPIISCAIKGARDIDHGRRGAGR